MQENERNSKIKESRDNDKPNQEMQTPPSIPSQCKPSRIPMQICKLWKKKSNRLASRLRRHVAMAAEDAQGLPEAAVEWSSA